MNKHSLSDGECLRCKKGTVYRAAISPGEGGAAMTLRREHQKTFYFWSVPGVPLPGEVYVCWQCGCVWSQVNPQKFRGVMRCGNEFFVRHGPSLDTPGGA